MNNQILWIYDRLNNYKGSGMIRKAILDNNNTKFACWNSYKKINYDLYSKVIFDFNEDRIRKNKLRVLENIASNFISSKNNPVIYNNPILLKHTTNKFKSYELLKKGENEVVKIPNFSNSITKDINYYPVILKTNSNATNNGKDCICKNFKQLRHAFKQNNMKKNNIIISQLINSFDPIMKKYHKVRWMVYGNKIIEQQVCFNKVFNVHNKHTSTKTFLQAKPRYEEFKKKNINEINKFLDFHKSVFGEGFFALDVIFDFIENKIYLCETSIKFYDNTAKFIPKVGRKTHFTNQLINYLT